MKPIYDIIERSGLVDGQETIWIRLDSAHCVYKSHFEGHPITPGAVILQICLDLLPANRKVCGVKNVKFLKPHEPVGFPELDITMTLSETADFVVSFAETVFAKLKISLE